MNCDPKFQQSDIPLIKSLLLEETSCQRFADHSMRVNDPFAFGSRSRLELDRDPHEDPVSDKINPDSVSRIIWVFCVKKALIGFRIRFLTCSGIWIQYYHSVIQYTCKLGTAFFTPKILCCQSKIPLQRCCDEDPYPTLHSTFVREGLSEHNLSEL